MTVKCIADIDKADIVFLFSNGSQGINKLALIYGRSRRTIIRVLEEQDIDPGVKHRKPKAMLVKQVDIEFTGWPDDSAVHSPAPAPRTGSWFRKSLTSVAQLGRRVMLGY